MDRTVARLNIEYFRKLLLEEMGEAKRQTILHLLTREEAKLAALDDPASAK
jgi:hypothetical protein